MPTNRAAGAIVVSVSFLLVASIFVGGVFGTPTATSTKQPENASTHTLVITSTNGTGSYSVTTSTGLQLAKSESSDYRLRGSRVSGTVGEQGDTKDVIHYTGYIESIQVDKTVQITLDGQQRSPQVLAGQHIQITRQNNISRPIRYHFAATGQVSRGELAEQGDRATNGTVRGHVRNRADSFYVTRELTNDSLSITGPAHVTINGQNASVFLTHAPPTASPTPRSPSTALSPSSPTTTANAPPTPTIDSTNDNRSPPDTPASGFFDQILHLISGLVTGLAAIVVLLYLFVGE